MTGAGEAIVTHVVSADQVIVRDLTTGAVKQVPIRTLRPAPRATAQQNRETDLSLVSDEDWAMAQMRYAAIKPLLEPPRIDSVVLQEVAASSGRHPATIYRWLKRYREERHQTALIPVKRGVEPGHSRLQPEVEAIISAAIKDRYLTRNRVKATQLHRDITLNCRSAGFPVPHVNTVRNRISRIAPRTVVEGRSGKRAAQEQFEPIKGHFPSEDHPLAVIQIDHTKLDLIVVDEVDRKPLARPWFTVAIDVFSRTVAGFYLSLEAPSAASTGMCVACAILPKDSLLARWGISTRWPVWGKMAAIHCDNGKDFRGAMLRRACQEYGIELRFRPARQPHYGGHIERLMGTFAVEVHTLPGTTFANAGERKGYDSEKHSALTISELELWLARYIVENLSPKTARRTRPPHADQRIRRGNQQHRTAADLHRRGTASPRFHAARTEGGDRQRHRGGQHLLFPRCLAAVDQHEEKDGRRRRLVVRRDPRDISLVHFFDPELKQYFAIPYRDTSHPPLSVWELREVRRRLRQEGRDSTNEDVIFSAYEQMRNIEETAVNKTREMRRNIERRISRQTHSTPPAGSSASAGDADWWEEQIHPFKEVLVAE